MTDSNSWVPRLPSYNHNYFLLSSLLFSSALYGQPYAYVSIVGPTPAHYSSIAAVVSIVSTETQTIIGTAGVNADPVASALSADGTLVYSASYLGMDVAQISVQTGLPTAQFQVPFGPISVAADPSNPSFIYVGGADSLVILDTTSGSVVQTFPFGAVSLATFPAGTSSSGIYASYQGSVYWIDALSRTLVQIINLQQPAGVKAGKIVASSHLSLFVETVNATSGRPTPSPIVTFVSNGDAMSDIAVTQVVHDIAISPDGNTLYATGGQDIFKWAVEPQITPIGSFAAGQAPQLIVVSSDGSTAYVSDATNSIETVSLASENVTSRIGVLGAVRALTLTQNSSQLFVSNDSSATDLVPIYPSNQQFLFARFAGFDPFTSAVSPSAQFLWTSCKSGNGVLTNTAVFPPYSYFFQFAPSYAVFSPDSNTLYVTHSIGTATTPRWAISSLNSTTLEVTQTAKLPENVTIINKPIVTPDNRTLFVPAVGAHPGIYAITISSGAVTGFIPLPTVSGIAISPDGKTLYAVYNNPVPTIAVINVGTKEITKSFSPPVTTNLQYIAVSPDGTRIYAAGAGATTSGIYGVTVADNSNSFYVTEPDAGLNGIAVTANGSELFFSDSKSNNAVSLDTLTGATLNTTFLFGYASDVVIAR